MIPVDESGADTQAQCVTPQKRVFRGLTMSISRRWHQSKDRIPGQHAGSAYVYAFGAYLKRSDFNGLESEYPSRLFITYISDPEIIGKYSCPIHNQYTDNRKVLHKSFTHRVNPVDYASKG